MQKENNRKEGGVNFAKLSLAKQVYLEKEGTNRVYKVFLVFGSRSIKAVKNVGETG